MWTLVRNKPTPKKSVRKDEVNSSYHRKISSARPFAPARSAAENRPISTSARSGASIAAAAAAPVQNANKKITQRKKREIFWFYLFLMPGLVGFCLLSIYPFFRALFISFTDRTLLAFEPTAFVALKNYIRAFNDPYVWDSLVKSLVYAFFTVLTVNGIGLLTALLLNAPAKGIRVFRTLLQITGFSEEHITNVPSHARRESARQRQRG